MNPTILRTLVVAYMAISASSLRADAASFDCKAAKTTVEKMICVDERLSRLDDELAEA